MRRGVLLAALGVLLLAGCGQSRSTATMARYGSPGDGTKADRTIVVHILSSIRYDPAAVSVMAGETVTFKVSNDSAHIHDFVLGDSKVQDSYQKLMSVMGDMSMSMPDHSNILNVEPGKTKQPVWTFPSASGITVLYGSHQPGDYTHGLKGLITVEGAGAQREQMRLGDCHPRSHSGD